ncbi:MAG: CarD family transcriptional regulator [Desulfovibrio sp.]|jgi:CarD family transcriptional regulator|nr:CarD family transcriptional regulator [Desulfovibrio sp.]
MYTPNELVVYPAQGVGIIERIDSQTVGSLACEFYIVHIKANNITLMVPVENAVKVGLRPLTPKSKANNILESLKKCTDVTVSIGQNWNRRFREYSERLKSTDLGIVTEVLRELLLIGRTKELSFGERRLQEHAMGLVTGELSEVLRLSDEALREELLQIYSQYSQQKNHIVDNDEKKDEMLCPVVSE